MSASGFRVFQHGKGTFTRWDFTGGKRHGKIRTVGAGKFIDRTFRSVADAKNYCEAELKKNRTLIFHVIESDEILETVLDAEFQRAQERGSRIRSSMISLVIVTGFAVWILMANKPFQSLSANLAVASAFVLLYLIVLFSHNWNWLESFVVIVLILVMLALLLSSCNKARERRQKRERQQQSASIHKLVLHAGSGSAAGS